MKPGDGARSRLERRLESGGFAVTAETTPPATADGSAAVRRARPLLGLADAVNVTDGARARSHLGSLAAAGLLRKAGIEPVLQFTCRDRNRLALQSDLLGAAALGVVNILCLGGDPIENGEEPDAKAVFDLDSVGLVALARRLSADGRLGSGREVEVAPHFLIGAADVPVDPPAGWRPKGLIDKIAAGARFIQTQYCFDMARCRRYMAALVDLGLVEKARFLIGLGPLASARQARWMRDNLHGVEIPDWIVDRLEGAPDEKAEGRRICRELIAELREIPGVSGVHLMAPRQEAEIARLIREAGLGDDRRED